MVRKGAEDIMGGKILEYEAKTIYQNGIRLNVRKKIHLNGINKLLKVMGKN